MKTGWTGGQYSLYRFVFGIYLLIHFVELLPWGAELFSNVGVLADGNTSPLLHLFPNVFMVWDSPAFVYGFISLAVVISVAFAIGWWDRVAAVGLWYILACLHGRLPLIINPGMPYVGWLLLAHAFLPSAPFGSLAARGRVDPRGSWKMNDGIWTVAWILMAVGYSYSGITKLGSPSWVDGSALERVLENPLARPGWPRDFLLLLPTGILKVLTWSALAFEIMFAPLALFRQVRPWIWLAMLLMHLSLMLVIDFADLSFGMVILHFFTFDPQWIPGTLPNATETVFYDGECGLCHRAVRFILAEDPDGSKFRFAPLQSESFQKQISEEDRKQLADSFVIKSGERALTRSTAVRHLLNRLGGLWRLISIATVWIPRVMTDRMYDGVASIRKKVFAKSLAACPVLPADLRGRFDY